MSVALDGVPGKMARALVVLDLLVIEMALLILVVFRGNYPQASLSRFPEAFILAALIGSATVLSAVVAIAGCIARPRAALLDTVLGLVAPVAMLGTFLFYFPHDAGSFLPGLARGIGLAAVVLGVGPLVGCIRLVRGLILAPGVRPVAEIVTALMVVLTGLDAYRCGAIHQEDNRSRLEEHLKRLPITIRTDPPGLEVRGNGQALGVTPLVLHPFLDTYRRLGSDPSPSLELSGKEPAGGALSWQRHLDLGKLMWFCLPAEDNEVRFLSDLRLKIRLGGPPGADPGYREGVKILLDARRTRFEDLILGKRAGTSPARIVLPGATSARVLDMNDNLSSFYECLYDVPSSQLRPHFDQVLQACSDTLPAGEVLIGSQAPARTDGATNAPLHAAWYATSDQVIELELRAEAKPGWGPRAGLVVKVRSLAKNDGPISP